MAGAAGSDSQELFDSQRSTASTASFGSGDESSVPRVPFFQGAPIPQFGGTMRQFCLNTFPLYSVSASEQRRKCMYCTKTFAESTSASSLEYHLKTAHTQKWSLAPVDKQRMTGLQQQPTLQQCLSDSEVQQAFNNLVTSFIHHPAQPLSLCDCPIFRKTLKSTANVTSRNVRTAILERDQRVFETLHKLLRGKLVGLQVDGGKTISRSKVLGIGFTLQGKFYCWRVFECDEGAVWDTDFYARVIGMVIDEIEAHGALVVSVSADNEASTSAGIQKLVLERPHLIHNRCFCHTCELLVLDLQKKAGNDAQPAIPLLESVDTACNRVVNFIRGNKYASNALSRSQGTNPLCLVKPSNTRKWSSTFLVVARFCRLYDHIAAIDSLICIGPNPPIEQIKARREWQAILQAGLPPKLQVEAVRDFLYWIYIAEQVLQRDVSSIIHAAEIFESISNSLGQVEHGRPLPGMIQQSMNSVAVAQHVFTRREILKRSSVYNLALFCWPKQSRETALHTSATREMKTFVTQSWPMWQKSHECVKLPAEFRADPENAQEMQSTLTSFMNAVMREMTEFLSNSNDINESRELFFAACRSHEDELSSRTAGPKRARNSGFFQRSSLKDFWASIAFVVPHLYIVVTVLLCICSSEAAVERMFSKEGFIHNKYRNKLKHEFVEALVRCCINTAAFAGTLVYDLLQDNDSNDDNVDE